MTPAEPFPNIGLDATVIPIGSPTPTVGTRLREAREKRGVSLRQIAASTRISVMSLEALERSDFARLPGGIFTRAFVRAYAQEVGLDPDRTIQDFIAELPPESVAASARSVAIEDGEQLESDRKAVTTAIRLVLVSLLIAGLLVFYAMHRRAAQAEGDAVQASPTQSSAVTVPQPQPIAEPATAASTPVANVAPASGLTMEIAPKAECWVSVTIDGEPAFSGLMKPGDKRQVAARDEISLNVGDAGAFGYTLNGKQGRPLGAPGEVVSKRITPADLNDYLMP